MGSRHCLLRRAAVGLLTATMPSLTSAGRDSRGGEELLVGGNVGADVKRGEASSLTSAAGGERLLLGPGHDHSGRRRFRSISMRCDRDRIR